MVSPILMTYIAFSNVQTELTTEEPLALDDKDVDFLCRDTWVLWLSMSLFTLDKFFFVVKVRIPTLVAIRPIHDDKKYSTLCRQVRTDSYGHSTWMVISLAK